MLTRPAQVGRSAVVWILAAALFAGIGVGMAFLPQELQVALVVLTVIGGLSLFLVPQAARKEPTVSTQLLAGAVAVGILGILARYAIFAVYYGGSGDMVGYHNRGVEFHTMVRSLDFTFISFQALGTPFVGYFNSFLYAITGPSMLGSFLVFGMLSFMGKWFFYKAHRLAFPDGERRLFFAGLFFLPSMVYWPASLGKDALVIFGLGLGTLGLAHVFRGRSGRGALALLVGIGITFLIREGVAVLFILGVAGGLLVRPGRLSSPFSRPLRRAVLLPVLLVGVVVATQFASETLQIEDSVQGVIQEHQETSEGLQKGGSAFSLPPITSPFGLVAGLGTVLFRPFVWELGDPLGAVQGLEGILILALFVFRGRQMFHSLKRWRGGMIVTALLFTMTLTFTLTSFTNFGLLARQRTQLIPFLLMLFTAVVYRKVRSRGRRSAGRRRAVARPRASVRRDQVAPAPAEVGAGGDDRMRRMASPTARG